MVSRTLQRCISQKAPPFWSFASQIYRSLWDWQACKGLQQESLKNRDSYKHWKLRTGRSWKINEIVFFRGKWFGKCQEHCEQDASPTSLWLDSHLSNLQRHHVCIKAPRWGRKPTVGRSSASSSPASSCRIPNGGSRAVAWKLTQVWLETTNKTQEVQVPKNGENRNFLGSVVQVTSSSGLLFEWPAWIHMVSPKLQARVRNQMQHWNRISWHLVWILAHELSAGWCRL